MTLVAGLALVVNLGLNLALIPPFQQVGAAFTTAATEGFILVYLLVVMPRDLLARSTFAVLAKTGVASAAMAFVLVALPATLGVHSLLLLIPVGGAVYVLAGLALRLVPAEDLRLVGAMVRRRQTKGPELAKEGRMTNDEIRSTDDQTLMTNDERDLIALGPSSIVHRPSSAEESQA